MREYLLKVKPGDSGLRLDLLLAQFAIDNRLGFSREAIQKMIRERKVILNNLKKITAHYKVKTQDQIKIIVEEKKENILRLENIPLDVIYEDQDLAIINKPCGLVVHPAPGNYEHTLVNALLYRFKNLSDVNPKRPGIVHRLDKETSGLLVIAKNNFSHLELTRQFAKHTIQRIYIAVVKGEMEFDENMIDLPIARHPFKRKNMKVSFQNKAKSAQTYYRTLKRSNVLSLLELRPFTGRTHQLRVHLAFLGHPILGDNKYGRNNKFPRLCLHAKTIGFMHPRTKKIMSFSSNTPKEFTEVF
jgi:23S rRNA pseudouridine1911/1915/1917 synthase